MKRAIEIMFDDGTKKELVLSKATAINTQVQMINIEQLKDGTWRLVYNENLIPDFSKVVGLQVKRED